MANLSLVFIKHANKILLINRNKSPFMGMWNALGGHQEENETIEQCAIRECKEEGKVILKDVTLISISTWNFDDDNIYVYEGHLKDDFNPSIYPLKIDEGIIDLKDIDWLIDKHNLGVVPDLKIFINDIKNNIKQNYHLVYSRDGKLLEYKKKNVN